ncbi:MAG: hypothetical protein EOP38_16055 [Rubrivivax sp.]|nr:MAG: hypothetical protein EOP38_16055 [Rubrivivax sp.]
MTRLSSELHRLYLPCTAGEALPLDDSTSLIDADGQVRALVLSLGKPADWAALSAVWQAVQAELALPAPAIAVSGLDAYQLWFSLDEPVSVAEARAFLDALCQRHLSHIAPSRIDLLPPATTDHAASEAWHAGRLPVRPVRPDQWSAFVAPDLAPIFADTPWLDIPPNLEGQADLLSRLQRIKPDQWQSALAQLRPAPSVATISTSLSTWSRPQDAASCQDPKRFLLDVMNDDTVALALRMEAAKALLPYLPSPP